MKSLLLLALLFPASAALITYTSPTGDFSFKISEYTNAESQKSDAGYGEKFYVYNPKDSVVLYTFAVTKIENMAKGVKLQDIDNDEFRSAMLQNCNCNIDSKKDGEFKNMQGVHYQLSFPGSMVRSFQYTTLKDPHLYTINFQANGDSLELFSKDYKKIMNSFEIYK